MLCFKSDYAKKAKQAKEKAISTRRIVHLIELDFEDRTKPSICFEEYIYSQEFEAFNGHLIASYSPN